MDNLFIGWITDSNNYTHYFISTDSESGFDVDIWDNEMSILKGHFRKWYHLTDETKRLGFKFDSVEKQIHSPNILISLMTDDII